MNQPQFYHFDESTLSKVINSKVLNFTAPQHHTTTPQLSTKWALSQSLLE